MKKKSSPAALRFWRSLSPSLRSIWHPTSTHSSPVPSRSTAAMSPTPALVCPVWTSHFARAAERLRGLRVASPEGFKANDAFSLGDITVDIDLKSVREDPVVIDEIRIRAPVVNAEVTKTGASNIDELRKRVQAYTAGVSGGGDGKSGGETKKLRIKRFVFEQGRVEVDASALGVEKRTITLPEIRLSDVGGASGAAPDEIAKVILTTVAKKVMSEIAELRGRPTGQGSTRRLDHRQSKGAALEDRELASD